MRIFARLLLFVGAAVAASMVAACNPINDKRYMDEGAGVELGYWGLSEATKQQDIYVKQVCQQAGYPQPESPDGVSSCMENSGWNKFVMAGINDINRRCDGYLTWLDARRRDRAPVLKELLALSGASHSILTATGADHRALDIVSAAITLAGATYENWNSRLLLAINQSTVVDIVYSRQAQFVDQMKDKYYYDRPTAIYVLRNYLRLCMPTTIEADINTSMTLVQRGSGADAKNRPIVPLIGVPSARQYLPPPPPVSDKIGHPLSGAEETIHRPDGIRIQTALKISGADGDFGPENSPTRAGLKEFEQGYYRAHSLRPPKPPIPSQDIDGVIRTDAERRAAMGIVQVVRDCGSAKFFSNYEMGVFMRITRNGVRTLIIEAATKLKNEGKIPVVPGLARVTPKQCDVPKDVRDAIKVLKKGYGLAESEAIDDSFMQKVGEGL